MTTRLSGPSPWNAPQWSVAPYGATPRNARRLLNAVATNDGAHVDRDFENTEAFLLYEQAGTRTSYIGRQPCPLTSTEGDLETRTRLLADCDMVLCSNISPACKKTLSDLGIDCALTGAGADISVAVSTLRRDPPGH